MIPELHLMLDTETLSTRVDAVVLETGWAVFDTHGQGVQQSGCWRLNVEEQLRPLINTPPRAVDVETLAWWMKQSDEARENAFHSLPRIAPLQFLTEMTALIPWHNIQGVWSHGLGFDLPILEHLHRQYGVIIPWHYKTPRDTRTLFWLAGVGSQDFVQPQLKHSAESDAIAQAETVQMAMRKLRGVTDAIATIGQ